MWPGAEPQKGVFNETYFNVSKTLINTLADHTYLHALSPILMYTAFLKGCYLWDLLPVGHASGCLVRKVLW